MVSEKIIVVLLIVAVLLSALSVIMTIGLNISTPINVIGESKTVDTGSAKIRLYVEPALVPSG